MVRAFQSPNPWGLNDCRPDKLRELTVLFKRKLQMVSRLEEVPFAVLREGSDYLSSEDDASGGSIGVALPIRLESAIRIVHSQ
jgi:hypothetical protein